LQCSARNLAEPARGSSPPAEITLPDGTRLLGVHAAPGRDDGSGLRPDASDGDLHHLVSGAAADLICVGHTHRVVDRHVAGTALGSAGRHDRSEVHVVNVGSVSNPVGQDRRASYALLDADASGYRLALHRVVYDYDAVTDAIRRSRLPAGPAAWMLKHFASPQTLRGTSVVTS
jgi:diadenosine tetraphosphatase ApaH/serine/threonine PP2A family protein phosphatase